MGAQEGRGRGRSAVLRADDDAGERVLAEVHNEKLRMSTVLRKEDHEVWRAGRAGGGNAGAAPLPQ